MTRLLQAAPEGVSVAVSSRADCLHKLRSPVKVCQQFQTGQILACSHCPPQERAQKAKIIISTRFNSKQQVFLDFVLSQYIKVGVDELAQEKLSPLLKLKYHNAIADAVADLGRPEEIGKVFAGFQKYLYEGQPAAA